MPQAGVQREFLAALARGDTGGIRRTAAAGADLNLPIGNPGGETPLIRAVSSGDTRLVRLLLELGADVNLPGKGPRSWTALMFAHNQPEVLRVLAEAGADLNARTTPHTIRSPLRRFHQQPGGETALHLAAAVGNAEAVRALIQAGADVEARADNGLAPFDYAIQAGNVTAAAQALGEAGAELTPERLDLMHSAAHNPESDLISFPAVTEPAPGRPELMRHVNPGAGPEQPPSAASRSAAQLPELRCPQCHALMYSRKARLCGQCGALLPRELVLTDEQAQAERDARQWAQDLADKFSPPGRPKGGGSVRPTSPMVATGYSTRAASAEALLHRVSCAEEFKHRPRPAFWLYAAGYTLSLAVISLPVFFFTGLPSTVLLTGAAFYGLLCWRAWHVASPVCPNCHQDIRLCAAEFCYRCGRAIANRRCPDCGVDESWFGFLPFHNGGNYGWIVYCPGCGATLESKVSRWRAR